MKKNALHSLENCLFVLEAGLKPVKQCIIDIKHNDTTGEYTITANLETKSSMTVKNITETLNTLRTLLHIRVTDYNSDNLDRSR